MKQTVLRLKFRWNYLALGAAALESVWTGLVVGFTAFFVVFGAAHAEVQAWPFSPWAYTWVPVLQAAVQTCSTGLATSLSAGVAVVALVVVALVVVAGAVVAAGVCAWTAAKKQKALNNKKNFFL